MTLPDSVLAEITCLLNEHQEPWGFGGFVRDRYVMLRRSENTPLFDPRFVNYGYNKMQLIQHLRYKGFRFFVLVNSFAMDMPHRNSRFRNRFLNTTRGPNPMEKIYSSFMDELRRQYGPTQKIPICASNKTKNFYKVMAI